PHVARLEAAFLSDQLDDVGDGELHVREEHRQPVTSLRDRLAGRRMEDAVRAVVGFGDDRRDRRMDEMQVHLVGDLFERAAHDRECDGIGHAPSTMTFWKRSTRTFMRGSTTVVVSDCSMIAGPAMVMPGLRSARRKIGVSIHCPKCTRRLALGVAACALPAPLTWRSTRLRLPSTVVRTLMTITGMPASVLPNSAL